MNLDLYQRVLDQIKAHPATWCQKAYHSKCNTKHCFAGWAEILSGQSPKKYNFGTHSAAGFALELLPSQANYLFATDRTLADFEAYLEQHS